MLKKHCYKKGQKYFKLKLTKIYKIKKLKLFNKMLIWFIIFLKIANSKKILIRKILILISWLKLKKKLNLEIKVHLFN